MRCRSLRHEASLADKSVACVRVDGIARRADAATLTLAWDPNPETNIAGYVADYGTQPGNYTTNVDVGKVTSRQLTNVVAGTTYDLGG